MTTKENKNRQSLINPYGFVICDTHSRREHTRWTKELKLSRYLRNLLFVLRWEGSECFSILQAFSAYPGHYTVNTPTFSSWGHHKFGPLASNVYLRPIPIRWNVKVIFPQGQLFNMTCVHGSEGIHRQAVCKTISSTSTTAMFPVIPPRANYEWKCFVPTDV